MVLKKRVLGKMINLKKIKYYPNLANYILNILISLNILFININS